MGPSSSSQSAMPSKPACAQCLPSRFLPPATTLTARLLPLLPPAFAASSRGLLYLMGSMIKPGAFRTAGRVMSLPAHTTQLRCARSSDGQHSNRSRSSRLQRYTGTDRTAAKS